MLYANIIDKIIDKDNLLAQNTIKFYKTFGYLVIKNAVDEHGLELMTKTILEAAKKLYPTINGKVNIDRSKVFHSVFESNNLILEWFVEKKYINFLKVLLGENSAYFNSDANIFLHGGSWHRDHSSYLPSLKMLFYLQDSLENGSGDLVIIPGSHNVCDEYSSMLNRYGSWPTGINSFEKNFNGIVNNNRLCDENKDENLIDFPMQQIKVKKNDLIIFDNRLYHTVVKEANTLQLRLNYSLAFLQNPIDIKNENYLWNQHENLKNELDVFFEEISKNEDCRYHENLRDIEKWPTLKNHLYFRKYGYQNDGVTQYNSMGAQTVMKNFHERPFKKNKQLD